MVRKVTQTFEKQVKQLKTKLSHKKLNGVLIILGIITGLIFLLKFLEQYDYVALPHFLIQVISIGSLIVSIYFIATIILRLTINYIAEVFGSFVDLEHKLIITKLYSVAIYVLATGIVLWRMGVSADNITLFAGFVATGLALAVREVIISYIIWFILLTKKPFRIGDYIKVGDDMGLVKHIGTFYVLIDNSPTSYDDIIRIPNKTFLEKPIYNYGTQAVPIIVRYPIDVTTLDKIMPRVKKAVDPVVDQYTIAVENKDEKFYVLIKSFAPFAKKDNVQTSIIAALGKELR